MGAAGFNLRFGAGELESQTGERFNGSAESVPLVSVGRADVVGERDIGGGGGFDGVERGVHQTKLGFNRIDVEQHFLQRGPVRRGRDKDSPAGTVAEVGGVEFGAGGIGTEPGEGGSGVVTGGEAADVQCVVGGRLCDRGHVGRGYAKQLKR